MNASTPTALHTISVQHVHQILLGAQARGLDVSALTLRADIPAALLESPLARVTQAQYAALILALRRTMRDELWGLCSHPLPLGSFAHTCRTLVACQTLGEALALGLRQYRLLLHDFTPRLELRGGLASLVLVPRHALTPANSYALRTVSFFTYGLASWLAARRIPLLEVNIPHGCAWLQSDAPTLFQAPIRETAMRAGWTFEAHWLSLPVVQTPQSLADFMRQAPMGLLIRYRDQSSIKERIRRILRLHLANDAFSLEDIGRQLAMTPQTLRRRLREEGCGFRNIKDALRRDTAIEYLARPDMTLHQIAAQVGFSEASTFHRAFKSWTGVAPGEYRRSHLDAAPCAQPPHGTPISTDAAATTMPAEPSRTH